MRLFGLASLVFAAAVAAGGAWAQDKPDCKRKADVAYLEGGNGFTHLAARIAERKPITIVAFGSSSTAGSGASGKSATYPARLQVELQHLFPDVGIRVLNRGVGGEDVSEMLKRFDHDIMETKPDLVIWQLGTNAILRDDGIAPEQPIIMEGLRRFRKSNADLVLMDPQYAPKVLRDPDAEPMVQLIAKIAKDSNIALFHRFELMRYWRDDLEMPYERFLSGDLLHMNDYSYACTAYYLATAIAGDVKRTLSAAGSAQAGTPATVAISRH